MARRARVEAIPQKGEVMKFQATVVFEFQAGSIADAGRKLNDAVEEARERDEMEATVIELRTPPGSKSAVTLPPVSAERQSPGPLAASSSRSR
jgi:hypothetical protein